MLIYWYFHSNVENDIFSAQSNFRYCKSVDHVPPSADFLQNYYEGKKVVDKKYEMVNFWELTIF